MGKSVMALFFIPWVWFVDPAFSFALDAGSKVAETSTAEVSKTAAPKVQEPSPTELTWWKLILRNLLELVFAVLGLLMMAFVSVLMRKFKFDDQSSKINDILMKAAGYAEQISLKAAKLNGTPTQGALKMQMAVDFAKSLAKEYKLPDKGKEWWEEKLESWLGVTKSS